MSSELKKSKRRLGQSSKRTTILEKMKALPCQLIRYVVIHQEMFYIFKYGAQETVLSKSVCYSYGVAHTIGRRLLYPGSLQILQHAIRK